MRKNNSCDYNSQILKCKLMRDVVLKQIKIHKNLKYLEIRLLRMQVFLKLRILLLLPSLSGKHLVYLNDNSKRV